MKNRFFKVISLLLVVALFASSLSACGGSESTPAPTPTPDTSVETPIEPLVEEDPAVAGLSDEQRASMAMLNYLAYVVQEIHDSRRSGATMERIYDELINDVEPSGIDDTTLQAFNHISETITDLEATDRGLKRLSFLSGQDEAFTILSTVVPTVLETVDTFSEKGALRALAGLACTTIDTVADSSFVTAEELLYLESKWTLEDAEADTIMKSRTGMFDYMVRIAQGLPAGITLNENDIEDYITQTTKYSGAARLDWLERNQEKYQYFGYYWLDLADSYFENEDYVNCLSAIETYRLNDTGIFKLDKRLAQSMTHAVISAEETMDGNAYETAAVDYIDTIVANIGSGDWELRYYAARAYLDLYEKTKNATYLEKAYKEAKNNVQNLVPIQQEQNALYIADLVEEKASEGADKEENSLIKQYNKFLKEQRKVELPPVYGPLLRSCELLFHIADIKGISDSEKNIIDSILHDNPVFLSYELDKKFSFNRTSSIPGLSEDTLTYTGVLSDQKFTLPAVFAPAGTTIKGEAVADGQTFALEEWSVNEVDRNKSKDVTDFEAVYTCKSPKPIVFKKGDTVTLWLTPPSATPDEDVITIKMVVDKFIVAVPHFKVESIEE